MQGEHEAALQSLQAAQSRCSERLQTASTDETSSSSASDDKAVVWSPQQSSMAERRRSSSPEEGIPADPTRGLYVKTLLAKASIFRQLQRHTEADACMHEAKELDPAVGKYVKQ